MEINKCTVSANFMQRINLDDDSKLLVQLLQCHDTFYSPDGTDVNGRADYDYQDANGAVNQPKFEFVLMLGFNYYF